MGVDSWTLEEVTMDAGLASVWGFHESIEDLKHKLLCATLELEALRANAKEEIRKSEENINQLIHLLQVITHERDEARDQLQLLISKITQPDSPQMRQTRGSSSLSDSDSLSGPSNHRSFGASPVESFFNTAASPELPSIKVANSTCNRGITQQRQSPEYDRASSIIDGLVMKKPLPQKGKLLQAVLEAGPLLQTLLLAGPLPQWRNPPPLQQFQVPPVVAVRSRGASLLSQKTVPNPNNLAHRSPNVLNHEKFNGESHIYATNMMKRPCMRSFDNLNVKRQKTQCTGSA